MKVIPESFLFHAARHDLVEKKKELVCRELEA